MKINNTVYLFIYLLLLKLNFIFIKKKFIIIFIYVNLILTYTDNYVHRLLLNTLIQKNFINFFYKLY